MEVNAAADSHKDLLGHIMLRLRLSRLRPDVPASYHHNRIGHYGGGGGSPHIRLLISMCAPTEGRLNDSHALPPRRKSSTHLVSSPALFFHPLLPGAKASCSGSTAKLPSLTRASRSVSSMRTNILDPGPSRIAPSLMVVLRLP